jgi:CRISPR-associated exonuclease Cas4
MRIKHVSVQNYRSIRSVDIDLEPLMIFVGPNNCGKSNLLSALDFFFSSSDKGSEADRCSSARADDDTVVEVTFGELSQQDRTTFHQYVRGLDFLRVRKVCRMQDGEHKTSYHGYAMVPKEEWLNRDNADDYKKRDALRAIPHNHCDILTRYFAEGGNVSKARVEEFQEKFIEDHKDQLQFELKLESGRFLGRETVAAGILGDWYLIPAVRDLSDETKLAQTTAYGRLLASAIRDMRQHNEEFAKVLASLDDVLHRLNWDPERGDEGRPSELLEFERTLAQELEPWGVRVNLHLSSPDVEELFQRHSAIFVDDGVRTRIEAKGHGLQRWLIFGLIKAWASTLNRPRSEEAGHATTGSRARAATGSVFIAFEEPELFLHPQAQRQMLDSLKALSEEAHHQVLACTHSSFFVDMDLYRSICVLSKPTPQLGTKAQQCTRELFAGGDGEDKKRRFNAAYWFNPDRGELFFARRVGLVEGGTEKTIIPFLAKRSGDFSHDVSLVDCGGKLNLALYIEVLNAFTIRYTVVHDVDPITVEPGHKKYESQRRDFEENSVIGQLVDPALGTVVPLDPDFEGVAGISDSAKKTWGGPLAAFRRFEPEDSEVSEPLQRAIAAIYAIGPENARNSLLPTCVVARPRGAGATGSPPPANA